MPNDLKTKAYVLRRTNYAEADRILNLITPVGKISAIAKGARKAKSKLAGGIEMFSLVQINLHFGKSDMAVVTGTKMIKFYAGILKDLNKMELATMILKKISQAAESVDSPTFFEMTDQCLEMLDRSDNVEMVEVWFLINLKKVMGEEINLFFDSENEKLKEELNYDWDVNEKVLVKNVDGVIDANTIKIMRLMVSAELKVLERVKNLKEYLPEILKIAQA